MNVVEKCQIERLADDKKLVFGKVQSAALVCLLNPGEKLVGDVVRIVG